MPTLIRTFQPGHGLELAAIDHKPRKHFLVVANRGGHMEAVLCGLGLTIVSVLTFRSRILANGGAR